MASRHLSASPAFDWSGPSRTRRPVRYTALCSQRLPLIVVPRVQKNGSVSRTSIRYCLDDSWECTFARLDKLLNDASRHPVNGRIHLPLDNKEASSITIDNLPVVQTNSGEAATFHCPLQLTPNTTETPTIVWVHKGQVLAVVRSSGINVTAAYDVSHAVNITAAFATLMMKNLSWSDRGIVECQNNCPDDPSRFCRLQAFRLRVAPTRSEIFPLPMANVTVKWASEARFHCGTGFTHPLEAFDRLHGFIWRFNRQWLEAPQKHPLRDLIYTDPDQRHFRLYVPFDARHEALETLSTYEVQYSHQGNVASTLIIPKVDARRPARIECWVRPDYTREVWVMQTAYLHIVEVPVRPGPGDESRGNRKSHKFQRHEGV
ncbi:uncharacterized protein LOC129598194 [Paramacrobiotus metropolitanus]|uniref:uncharacterized protein LOC129598194 n=1 Tax=Paramacrobiotus metropolitanus TaxID=2943436 RepID=UPI0024456BAB|nr:uncharacterized protein LOC129598194 [Paramacrobiotus metropolitanus]